MLLGQSAQRLQAIVSNQCSSQRSRGLCDRNFLRGLEKRFMSARSLPRTVEKKLYQHLLPASGESPNEQHKAYLGMDARADVFSFCNLAVLFN